jgi:hypothetical protein
MAEVERRDSEVQVPGRFDAFYREEYSSVVSLVCGLSGSAWAAEDLAQEAFLFDLVAVQEVNNDLRGIWAVQALLPGYEILFSDKAGNDERMRRPGSGDRPRGRTHVASATRWFSYPSTSIVSRPVSRMSHISPEQTP